MRSTETVSKPAACAVSTAARACSALWRRPRKRRASSEKDCTPSERVRTPRSRQAAQASASRPRGWPPGRSRARRRERQLRTARAEDALEVLRRQQRGRSPAEVHGVEGPRVPPLARGEGHLGDAGARRSACGRGHQRAAPRSRSTGRWPSRRGCGGRALGRAARPTTRRPRRPRSGAPTRRPPAGSRPPPPSSSSSCPPSASRAACACGRCRRRSTSPSRPCGRG